MITSPPSTEQQQNDGRTIREIVEHNHEMVSESWCRRIFRQVLQSLEVQYGMRMPHRPITPDTLLILDSGDPMLLPSANGAPEPESPYESEAGDLHDLAAVIHYAITREPDAGTPLRGRLHGQYNDSFTAAVDRCLSPDPAARPQTIEQLRSLLGILVLGPPAVAPLPPLDDDEPLGSPLPVDQPGAQAHAVPASASASASASAPVSASVDAVPAPDPDPAPAPAADPATGPAPTRAPASAHIPVSARAPAAALPAAPENRQRWLMIGGVAIVLLAALIALFALLRQTDSRDALALAVPDSQEETGEETLADPQAPLVTLTQGAPARLEGPVIDEITPGSTPSAPPAAPDAAVPPTAVRLAPQGTPPDAAIAGTTYKLLIKPWGTIMVDDIARGASPPLKHITLPAGEHTIRIVNPNFPEHTVTVKSVPGQLGTIELDFTEEETP